MTNFSALPIDRLLEHRDWLRRVARVLVRDEAAAEDLEQEVWLDALRRPPADAVSPRGWLRRALRNNAVDAGRAARRRVRREEAVARPEAISDTSAIVAEAELLRRVADAVLALDEPYREAVLLRWYEGTPPGEIAARQGIPVETVRTRLKRALATLRARFDAEHRGDRAAWTVPLLPIADRVMVSADGHPEVHFRVLPHQVRPAAALWALGTLLVALCGSVAAIVVSGSGDREDVAEIGAQDGGAAGTDDAATGGDGRSSRRGATRPADAGPQTDSPAGDEVGGAGHAERPLPAGTWIAIHVLGDDGRPLDEATLRLDFDDPPPALQPWQGEHAIHGTNPFPVYGLPRTLDQTPMRITAWAPGRVTSDAVDVTLDCDRTQVTRVVLAPPRTLAVHVTDAVTGEPVAGARVVSSTECKRRGVDVQGIATPSGDGWATTDAEGFARLGGLGRGRHEIQADASHFLPRRATGTSGSAGAVALALAPIARPGTIRVVVRGAGAAPVVGSPVRLQLEDGSAEFVRKTDGNGDVLFDDVPAGQHTVIADPQAVLGAGWPTDRRAALERQIRNRGCVAFVKLDEGGAITVKIGDVGGTARVAVRLVDASGAPLAGRAVGFSVFETRTTDADGVATFEGVAAGDVVRVAVGPWSTMLGVPATEDGTVTSWTVGSVRIEGMVVREDGAVVPARTLVTATSGDRMMAVATAAGGSFVLEDVPPGPCVLMAVPVDLAAQRVRIDVPADGACPRVEIRVRRGGVVRIGAKLPFDASLSLRDAGGVEWGLNRDRTLAVWRVSQRLPPGTYVLEGTVRGEPFRRDVQIRDGEDTTVDLTGD